MHDEDENWRVIEGYPDFVVSDRGRVLYLPSGRVMQQSMHNDYWAVYLSDDVETVRVRVHRLVADAFVEGRSDRRNVVNHIDGDKTYNCSDNLEWVTRAQNTFHWMDDRFGHSAIRDQLPIDGLKMCQEPL